MSTTRCRAFRRRRFRSRNRCRQALPGTAAATTCSAPASLGAAIAIKEQIAAGKLKGTVRFYGTPAEEAVGGKVYMAREGLFDGVDAVLAWHPSDETQADMTSSQAMVSLIVEFEGRTAHAAGDPWNGRSAVDAAELFTHGINMMREHVKPTSRMHYVILSGGDVPNVVPAYAKVSLWLRDWKRDEVEHLLARTRKVAEGAATMTETTGKVTVDGGSWEMLVNETGARLLHANLLLLGPVKYTNEEQAFARQIQQATGVPEVGMFEGVKPLEGQEARGRLDGRRGHQLGGAHAARLGRHVAGRRTLARLAGGCDGRHVDRPQGHGAGLEGARGHDGRPLRATAGPCGGAG